MQSELTEAAKKLSIPERILLVEEIWDTIPEENQAFELSDAQKNLNAGWRRPEGTPGKAAPGMRLKLNS